MSKRREYTTGGPKRENGNQALVSPQNLPPIPRETAEYLLQVNRESFLRDVTWLGNEFLKFQKDKETLLTALATVGTSLRCVFATLLFVDSVNWKPSLKKLLDAYNSDATSAVNVIHELSKKYASLLQEADIEAPFLPIESGLLETSSEINAAVTAAIGEGDGGAALHDLARKALPDLIAILNEAFASIRTEEIAPGRRFVGERRYIGFHCNVLEHEGGTKEGRKQWQTIYQNLKAQERNLKGDEIAALDFFRLYKPFDEPAGSDKLRRFQKLISDMKCEMEPYYLASRGGTIKVRTNERTKRD